VEKYKILTEGEQIDIQYLSSNCVMIDGNKFEYEIINSNSEIKKIKIGNNYFNIYSKEISENDYEVWIKHYTFRIKLEDIRSRLLSQFKKISSTDHQIVNVAAPMPGLIKAVEVNKGDIVEKGRGLIILEAMKMENEIRSMIKGKIKNLEVQVNDSVEKDQILLTIEPIIDN